MARKTILEKLSDEFPGIDIKKTSSTKVTWRFKGLYGHHINKSEVKDNMERAFESWNSFHPGKKKYMR